jgi:hypothetical protein
MKKYEMMQTKVRISTFQRAVALAKAKCNTVYRLIQMVIDTIVRYMDDRHNLTPEMEQAMSIFEHMDGWKDSINLADPSINMVVGEATYYLFDQEGKTKGCRAVHVTKPFFGNWCQDYNVQHILERTICYLFPERYRRLRAMAVDLNCKSLLELCDKVLDEHAIEEDLRTIRKEFEDTQRGDYGQQPADQPYRRRHGHMDMDLFEQHEAQEEERLRMEEERAASLQWMMEHPDEDPTIQRDPTYGEKADEYFRHIEEQSKYEL